MPRKNRNNNNRSALRNGNRSLGGAAHKPTRTLTKKFQYQETVKFDNATSTYAFHSRYIKPDVTKAIGAMTQFSAYEMWRLKKINVSVQLAATTNTTSSQSGLNTVASAMIWTAPDYGANESVSGESIMQYQNAKRNTCNLNKWTQIVSTDSMINTSLDTSQTWNYMMPKSTWVNTSNFNSTFYSGYQLFAQLPGFQTVSVTSLPGLTIQTELEIEFMQPAFQASVSSFSSEIYDSKLAVIPDAAFPSVFRNYVYESTMHSLVGGEKSYSIRFVREDGVAGSLTYTAAEFLELYRTFTSGPYFGNRAVRYDGPRPDQYRN